MADPPGPLTLDGVDAGSNLLVAGPPMTGKYELLVRMLAGYGDRSILVSTEDGAATVRADYRELTGGDPADLAVVDCSSSGGDGSSAVDEADRSEAPTATVASPNNLTDVGVQFTELADAYRARRDAPTAVGFHSLSPLVLYWDADRVYKFVRVFLNQVDDAGWTGVAALGSTMHDEQALHTLYDPFDAVVETREGEGGRELRVRDGGAGGPEWRPF